METLLERKQITLTEPNSHVFKVVCSVKIDELGMSENEKSLFLVKNRKCEFFVNNKDDATAVVVYWNRQARGLHRYNIKKTYMISKKSDEAAYCRFCLSLGKRSES